MSSSNSCIPPRVVWSLCSRQLTLNANPQLGPVAAAAGTGIHLVLPLTAAIVSEPGILGILTVLYGWAFSQGSEQGLSSDISNHSGFSSSPPKLGWLQECQQSEKQWTHTLSLAQFAISQINVPLVSVSCFPETPGTTSVYILFSAHVKIIFRLLVPPILWPTYFWDPILYSFAIKKNTSKFVFVAITDLKWLTLWAMPTSGHVPMP